MRAKMTTNKNVTQQAIEIAIRLGFILLIVMFCFQILSPFIPVIIWGAIIAVAIYKPFLWLTAKLSGKKKLAATLISLIGIALILVPVISLSGSLIAGATDLGTQITEGTLQIPPPTDNVQSWPLVGEKLYAFWHDVSVNLTATIEQHSEQLSTVGIKLLGLAASVSGGALQFVISMIIAGVFLAGVEGTTKAMHRVMTRLVGEKGEDFLVLSTATVRSVAVGVLGIAVIQSLLAGLGMMFADVPAAGLIAFIVLLFAIAQLPPILVLTPVIFYVFSVASPTVAVIFMIWSLLVSVSDAVLKPLFLGRGVDAPMLVILLGAIGGMIYAGIVGLFTGAVILALGYKLFEAWLSLGATEQTDAVEK